MSGGSLNYVGAKMRDGELGSFLYFADDLREFLGRVRSDLEQGVLMGREPHPDHPASSVEVPYQPRDEAQQESCRAAAFDYRGKYRELAAQLDARADNLDRVVGIEPVLDAAIDASDEEWDAITTTPGAEVWPLLVAVERAREALEEAEKQRIVPKWSQLRQTLAEAESSLRVAVQRILAAGAAL